MSDDPNNFGQAPDGALPLPAPPPDPRSPAGDITRVLRTDMPDKLSADYLGSLVTSSDVTEHMIDAELAAHLAVMAAQDDLVESADGRIIGLRLTTVPRASG